MNRNAWLAFVALCTFYIMHAGPAFAGSMVNADNLMGMAKNVVNNLGGDQMAFMNVFKPFCILIGVSLVGWGIYSMTQRHKNGVVIILIGSVIVSMPAFINMMTSTIFDEAASQSIVSEYQGGGGKLETAAKIFITLSVLMIQIVGFIAVYKGLKTIADVAGSGQFQPTQQRTAMIFIISGIICINIMYTLKLVAMTMGDEGMKYYNLMFSGIG